MKGYGSFCPIAKAAEILAERWTLLVLRDLLVGSRHFNELRRGVPLMSPALLSHRLQTLEEAGLIERRAGRGGHWEYHPTQACEELRPVIEAVGHWGQRWVRSTLPAGELDAGSLMWFIHRHFNHDHLPPRRVVIYVEITDIRRMKEWWIIADQDHVDLCREDPGFEVDVSLYADLKTLTQIYLGDLSLERARGLGKLEVDGPRDLIRGMPAWFGRSKFGRRQSAAPVLVSKGSDQADNARTPDARMLMTGDEHFAALLATEQAAMKRAAASYRDYHEARFRYLLKICHQICPSPSAQILDVGLSMLSLDLLKQYENVTTLGFPVQHYDVTEVEIGDGRRRGITGHIDYDLNAAQNSVPIPSDERFDLIVFAEVIEHLHTAPELTLYTLKRLMKPNGYMVIQTPNAAALHKRFNLLFGRNPYDKIRINPRNPAHFREYTKAELIGYARGLGFEVVMHRFRDYFGCNDGAVVSALYKTLVAIVPVFARGQTLVLRNVVGQTR